MIEVVHSNYTEVMSMNPKGVRVGRKKRVYFVKTNGHSFVAATDGVATMGYIHQVKYSSHVLDHTFLPQRNRMGFISVKYV